MHCYWTRYMYQRDRSGRREKGEAVKRNMCASSMPCQQRKYFLVCEKKPLRTVSHVPCLRVNCSVSGVSLYLKRVGCESALQSVSKVCPWFITQSSHRPSRNSKLPIWPFNSAAKSYLAGESHVSYPGSPSWLQRGYLLLIAWHQYLACSNTTCAFIWKELSLMND